MSRRLQGWYGTWWMGDAQDRLHLVIRSCQKPSMSPDMRLGPTGSRQHHHRQSRAVSHSQTALVSLHHRLEGQGMSRWRTKGWFGTMRHKDVGSRHRSWHGAVDRHHRRLRRRQPAITVCHHHPPSITQGRRHQHTSKSIVRHPRLRSGVSSAKSWRPRHRLIAHRLRLRFSGSSRKPLLPRTLLVNDRHPRLRSNASSTKPLQPSHPNRLRSSRSSRKP